MDHSTIEFSQYKGYAIEANPPKFDGGTWGTYLVISRDTHTSAPRRRRFDDDERFDRRLDAVRHCFELGRKIIDGKVAGMSVEDL